MSELRELQLQMDLVTVIARIEQAAEDPGMTDFLIHRMVTCDVPRLRRHLSPESLALLADAGFRE